MVERELAHRSVTHLHVVPSMHARKARMAELAAAFIVMPGGYGTFEELFEIITWAQLGIHHKPIGLLNVAGYFDALLQLVEHAIAEGFIRPEHRQLTVVAEQPEALLEALAQHQPPPAPPWLRPQGGVKQSLQTRPRQPKRRSFSATTACMAVSALCMSSNRSGALATCRLWRSVLI